MFKWIVGSVTWCYCSWIVNDLIVHYVSLCYIVLMFMNIHDLFFLVRFPADGPRFCPNTCARCSRFCLCCFCGGVRYDLDQDWLVVSECFRYIRYKDILYTYIYLLPGYHCYHCTLHPIRDDLGSWKNQPRCKNPLDLPLLHMGFHYTTFACHSAQSLRHMPHAEKKSKCKDFEDFRSHQQGFSKSRTGGFSKLSPFLLIVATSWQLTASVQAPQGAFEAFEDIRMTW